MTQPIKYQNNQNPAYSGITINITNPNLTPPSSYNCQHCCDNGYTTYPQQQLAWDRNIYQQPAQSNVYNIPEYSYYDSYAVKNDTVNQNKELNQATDSVKTENNANIQKEVINETYIEKTLDNTMGITANNPQADTNGMNYPPQYYLNNYNYIQGQTPADNKNANQPMPVSNTPQAVDSTQAQATVVPDTAAENETVKEEDLSSSKEIINNLDAKALEQKELEKNGKKTRVVALTNEYIMSLENYLNNPNKEVRLMASKEILTRLDEDKDRFDDAALNALLNKMLQDPEKLVRIAALSAFASQLASGNTYTVELLNRIQQDPNADKDDVVQAANILLKMSATTEVRYTTVENNKQQDDKKAKAQQEKIDQLQSQLQKYKEKEVARILDSQSQGM